MSKTVVYANVRVAQQFNNGVMMIDLFRSGRTLCWVSALTLTSCSNCRRYHRSHYSTCICLLLYIKQKTEFECSVLVSALEHWVLVNNSKKERAQRLHADRI